MTNIKAIFVLLLAAVAAGVLVTAGSATPRSGALQVTKECSQNDGDAGDFCTITSSNINAIKPGSRVVYASAAGDPVLRQLNSDLIVDGPGNNTANGHVVLDLSTGTGVVTFSGGTGHFRGFRARIDVSPLGGPDFAWGGSYSFDPPEVEK
jgi:hypothetical protein